jgi:hypothetical protein
MKLVLASAPWLVQVLVWALATMMLAGIVAAFLGVVRVLYRSGQLLPSAEGSKLPIVYQRASEFYVAAKYRLERRLVGYGVLTTLGSMAVTFALILLFGQQA